MLLAVDGGIIRCGGYAATGGQRVYRRRKTRRYCGDARQSVRDCQRHRKQVDTASDGTKQYVTVAKNSGIHVLDNPTTANMTIGAVMSIKVTYDKNISTNTPVQVTTDDRSVIYTSNAKDIIYVVYHNTPLIVGSAICPKLDNAGWTQVGWVSASLDPAKTNTFHVV